MLLTIWQSFTLTCVFDGTHGPSTASVTQWVECVTMCCCLCNGGPRFVGGGLVRARLRVGFGAEDRGCVEAASLSGYCRAWENAPRNV